MSRQVNLSPRTAIVEDSPDRAARPTPAPLPADRPEGDSTGSRCWVCGSENTRPFKPRGIDRNLVSGDLTITDSRYGLTLGLDRCRECGFVFARRGQLGDLVALYAGLEDSDYERTQDCRAGQMRWLLSRVRRLDPEAKTLLDVGAGAGALVAEARRAGYEAIGVEPSRALVDAARRIHGVHLIEGVYPHPRLEGKRFDVVLVVDVIEHVDRPLELVQACREALAPGGVLVIVTPDLGSLTARVLGNRWWHFRLAHVGYFSTRSLLRLTGRCGLEVVCRRRPVWFFSITYLAERLQQYLPLRWINKLARRVGLLRRLDNMVIPLNLHDSMLVALRRAAE